MGLDESVNNSLLDEKVDNSFFEEPLFKRALERSPYFIREDKDFVKWLKDNFDNLDKAYFIDFLVPFSSLLYPFASEEIAHHNVFIERLPLYLKSSPQDTTEKFKSYAQKAFFFLEILHEEGRIGTWDKERLEDFIQSKSKKNEQELQEILYYGTAQVFSFNLFKYVYLLGAKHVFLALGELKKEFKEVFNEIINQKNDVNEGLKDKIKGLIETHQFLDVYIETAKEIINGGEDYSLGKHYKLFEEEISSILGEQDKKLEEQMKKEVYVLFDIVDGLSRRWPFYYNKIKANVVDDDIP